MYFDAWQCYGCLALIDNEIVNSSGTYHIAKLRFDGHNVESVTFIIGRPIRLLSLYLYILLNHILLL